MKKIAIDLVPIRVGEGGAGSGIWTYARELVLALDKLDFQGLEIMCLVNDGQRPYLSSLQHIKLIPFPVLGKNIFKRLCWNNLQLPFWCLLHKVDVLHKVATETPLICSAKRVTTIHDFYYEYLLENNPSESIRFYERMENFYFSFVTRLCFKKSKAVIAVSNATKNEAVARFPECADRIRVIHHGAPCSRGQRPENGEPLLEGSAVKGNTPGNGGPSSVASGKNLSQTEQLECGRLGDPSLPQPNAQRLTPSASSFTILCVAKFMEHKGQHLLIEAFDVLLDTYPDLVGRVHLNLRGFHNDQAYFDEIKKQIKQSLYIEQISIIEYDPEDTTETIYAEANLVVLLSNYEGFGLPVLEAQSMGKPVLCSKLPVLQEVGGAGAVYENKDDASAIATQIFRLITDAAYYSDLKENAVSNTAQFSWYGAAQKTLSVYRGC